MPDYFTPILEGQRDRNDALLKMGLVERQNQQARDIEQMRQEAETERFRQQAQTYFDRLEQQGQNQIRLQAAKDEADEVQRLNIYARGVGVGPYQTGESKDEFTQRVNKAAGELIGRYQKQSSRLAVDMPRKLKEARALTPEQELQAAKAGLLVLQQNPATAKLSSGPIAPQTTKGIQELIGTLSSSASREVSAAATSASMAMLEKSSEIAASKPEAQEQAEMFKMMMEDYRSSIANAQALRTHYPGGIQFIPEPVLPPAPPRAVEKAKGEGATAQAEPKREFGIGGTPTASSSIPMAIAGKMFSDAVRTPGQDAIAERAVRLGMSPEAAAGVSAAAESMPSMPLGPVTSMNPVSTQSGYAFGSGLVPKVLEYAAKTIPYGAKVFAAPYNPYLNPTEDTQALLQYALPALFQARSAGQAIGPGAAAVGDWLPAIASTVMGLRGFGSAPRGAAMPTTAMPRVVSSVTQPWMRDWMAVAPEQQAATEAAMPGFSSGWTSVEPQSAASSFPSWLETYYGVPAASTAPQSAPVLVAQPVSAVSAVSPYAAIPRTPFAIGGSVPVYAGPPALQPWAPRWGVGY